MKLDSKRLLELAGLPVDENSSVLTEGVEESEDCEEAEIKETEEQEECDESQDVNEQQIRNLVRGELESMWASGQVFGVRTKGKQGQVTVGFPGIGFKR